MCPNRLVSRYSNRAYELSRFATLAPVKGTDPAQIGKATCVAAARCARSASLRYPTRAMALAISEMS
jgi:hypothetical protein